MKSCDWCISYCLLIWHFVSPFFLPVCLCCCCCSLWIFGKWNFTKIMKHHNITLLPLLKSTIAISLCLSFALSLLSYPAVNRYSSSSLSSQASNEVSNITGQSESSDEVFNMQVAVLSAIHTPATSYAFPHPNQGSLSSRLSPHPNICPPALCRFPLAILFNPPSFLFSSWPSSLYLPSPACSKRCPGKQIVMIISNKDTMLSVLLPGSLLESNLN